MGVVITSQANLTLCVSLSLSLSNYGYTRQLRAGRKAERLKKKSGYILVSAPVPDTGLLNPS